MASCYNCGCSGANYRRTVSTGFSSGTSVSKRSYGTSSRNYYGLRTVCEKCAVRIDKGNLIRTIIFLILVACGLIYFITFKI